MRHDSVARRFCVLPFAIVLALITCRGTSAQVFVRGEINDDRFVDVSDVIVQLEFLFTGGSRPLCLKAADTNDDAMVDVADPVFLLFHLFVGGVQIPSPSPEAGQDPTSDDLDCTGVADLTGGHQHILGYFGPATCVACHRDQAEEVHASVHYQQSGPTPNVTNIDGDGGQSGDGAIGFNTYCGTHVSSPRATCGGCHVGNGRVPSPNVSADQLANIDCLLCHQDAYKRKPAGPFRTVAVTGADGGESTIQVPVEDETGFQYVPDDEAMEISILEAARTVHLPTRESCLRCHAHAGGSDGAKRGDLSSATAGAHTGVHTSPAGGNFACQRCHEFEEHRVLGRGLDLRVNDRPERLTCERCHGPSPHDSSTTNRHTGHVACQTCHIPTYANEVSTELSRDWLSPEHSPSACDGQGGWKPAETRASNVIPSYEWFDGTSRVYVLGQSAIQNGQDEYALGIPNGSVNSTDAKIYPMKEHRSNSALHEASGQLIPHSTFVYSTTGQFDLAVEAGMEFAGLSGDWSVVPAHTYQTINHGVTGDALECGDCHEAYSGGAPVRMDLQGELGYGLKSDSRTVCTQCHGFENSKGFKKNHDKHVGDKDRDCSWCHRFSRPERGLRMP